MQMKGLILAVGIAFGALLVTSCDSKKKEAEVEEQGNPAGADTVEGIAEELGVEFVEFAKAARGAKDLATANESAAKLKKVEENMGALAERLMKLDVPSEEVRQALGKQLAEKERKIEEEMGDAEGLIDELDPDARKAMEEAMGGFGMRMQELLVIFGEYFAVGNQEE